MSKLPTIAYKGKQWFFDARLKQIRNVDNPHDYIDLNESMMKFFAGKLKEDEVIIPLTTGVKERFATSLIEQQVEEARRKEQQTKEQLKMAKEEYKRELENTTEEIISLLSELSKEEASTANKYQKLSNKYSKFPTVSRVLSDFAMEELRHSNRFFDLVHELKRELEAKLRE
jgi:hypothetical protein